MRAWYKTPDLPVILLFSVMFDGTVAPWRGVTASDFMRLRAVTPSCTLLPLTEGIIMFFGGYFHYSLHTLIIIICVVGRLRIRERERKKTRRGGA